MPDLSASTSPHGVRLHQRLLQGDLGGGGSGQSVHRQLELQTLLQNYSDDSGCQHSTSVLQASLECFDQINPKYQKACPARKAMNYLTAASMAGRDLENYILFAFQRRKLPATTTRGQISFLSVNKYLLQSTVRRTNKL